jgi:L-ascorbate metabolism protein UlaG (beta-lactamase superfamily)
MSKTSRYLPMTGILLTAILLAAVLPAAQARPAKSITKALEVTYVANEGFLIAGGSAKVLVDALFDEGFGTYQTPARPTRGQLENASPPFDGVGLILVTHWHDDHFNPKMVVAHLKNNPGATCVAPQQVVDKMKEEKDFDAVAKQTEAATPEPGEVISKIIGGIGLKIFGMRHAPYMENGVDRHRDVQNVGYLVTVGGVNMFHTGDAVFDLEEEFIQSTGIDNETIDVLFIEYFDMSENTQHLIKDVFKPQHVIGMHLPTNNIEKMAGVFPEVFAGGLVFKKSMEKQTFAIERDSRDAGDEGGAQRAQDADALN